MGYVGRGLNQTGGQYRKIDDISSSFDGSETSFTLKVSGVDITPTAQNLLISINGVIQEPGVGFTVSGSNITFGAALAASDVVDFIIVMGEVGNVQSVTDNSIGATKMASDMVADHTPIRVNNNSVDTNVTITSTKNAMAAGPLTLNATLTINGTMTVV